MTDGVLERAETAIRSLTKTDAPLLVAIDGRCAAGKTTLAARLRDTLTCGVIPMDDFFLRPEQRTEERLRQPGGNVDYERFREEVLLPLKQGLPFSYRPYDCRTQKFREPVCVEPDTVAVVEGSYSCHPELWDFYDLHIFLTVSPEEQRLRIRQRNGEKGLEIFQNKWIPLEERYFEAFRIEQRCAFSFQSDD